MSDACEIRPSQDNRHRLSTEESNVFSWQSAPWSQDEEWANGLTHAFGCLLSIVGSWLLLLRIIPVVTVAQSIACLVYCASLIGVYAASTLSHWVCEPVRKQRFREWDQGMIYLLIAGTYTPFGVTCLTGWWHLVTLLMWGIALAGFLSKVAFAHRVDSVAVWVYIALGWLPVIALPRLLALGATRVLWLMVAGGLAYSLGSVFLMNDRRARFFHVGWHLAVILGSVLHFWAVWELLLGRV